MRQPTPGKKLLVKTDSSLLLLSECKYRRRYNLALEEKAKQSQILVKHGGQAIGQHNKFLGATTIEGEGFIVGKALTFYTYKRKLYGVGEGWVAADTAHPHDKWIVVGTTGHFSGV
ncbi:unnamed protein product [Ceratitis capitata]|uniref:(Mediterranean fruit fly) hypothetical protein n=1 Tax=Ceratitis capitata TaxID=7213 RepID=A0A811UJJ0_CERCA|nr:unnamed protein product [Ceratitis capitata]